MKPTLSEQNEWLQDDFPGFRVVDSIPDGFTYDGEASRWQDRPVFSVVSARRDGWHALLILDWPMGDSRRMDADASFVGAVYRADGSPVGAPLQTESADEASAWANRARVAVYAAECLWQHTGEEPAEDEADCMLSADRAEECGGMLDHWVARLGIADPRK